MKPFFSIYMLCLIPLLAYGTAILLNWSIEKGYDRSSSELEFPDSLSPQRTKRRQWWLTTGLLLPYALALVDAQSWPILPIYGIYMAILTGICVMDFEQQIILDEFIVALIILAVAASFIMPIGIGDRLIAGAGGFVLFFLIAIVTHGGIGGGDVKLIGALGLFLGIDGLIFTIIAGIFAGGIVSLVLVLTKKKGRKDAIAYGPYFAVAGMLAVLL